MAIMVVMVSNQVSFRLSSTKNVFHNNNKMLLSDIDKVNRLCLLLLLIQSALYPDVTHISLYAPRRDAISLIFVAMRVSKH